MELEQLKQQFENVFKEKQGKEFFAPGRINLIGEHIDYNGGHVFPCAITIGTYGIASKREDSLIKLYSENFPELGIISFDVGDLDYRKEDAWTNYPKGMIRYLKENGHEIQHGMNILYYGTIPNGAGLSSSASIELLTGVILQNLFKLELEELELILIGKKVENQFIGVNSGIMDQFAIGKGQKNQAILLDCETLEYEMVPVELGHHKIVIMNTNKRRELADSKYNERRSECDQALKELQTKLKINSLGQLDEATFNENKFLISAPNLVKRAQHAVTENQRTLKAATALKSGDLNGFGKLMNASHRSLRDDYEVSGIELDTLVESAWLQPGVIGARMTGAGFGGCGIAIVAEDQIDSFIKIVGASYNEKIGYQADFYIASISDGAKYL
ncbi:galactokinase [Carnobacterium maltaromaticum]|uniref:galactokinase n=1 Tax=Carnobacterium maltaromaticum TaxID=2751 RepID=UPI00165CC870|nr:galactokinase [Carnobacterium maltaromaticum]MBC9789675.1 galactokinase [Carnobacterium maltaromaticum]